MEDQMQHIYASRPSIFKKQNMPMQKSDAYDPYFLLELFLKNQTFLGFLCLDGSVKQKYIVGI